MTIINISSNVNVETVVKSSSRVLTNGDIIFTIVGDVEISTIISECQITGTPAATTLQWQSAPIVGVSATFTGTSASLITAVAGSSLNVISGLTTAPSLVVSGANNDNTYPLSVWCPTGTIKTVVALGPSTGTWIHYMRYKPLEDGAYVTAI